MEIVLSEVKKVWFLGIKGTGMTSLAQIFKRLGKDVVGSDTPEVFFTDEVLKSIGVKFFEKFDKNNITKDIDLFIYSTAYDQNHEELEAAKKLKIPILSLPEAHGLIMKEKTTIAVAGTHGKTTTTAILGYILQQADFDPTVIVGAPVPQFDGSALIGGSKYLVMEACEYQNKFKYYEPTAILVNNIEYDHPDSFPTKKSFFKVFIDFAKKVPDYGFIVANVDDVKVQDLITQVNKEIITFGTVPSAEWRIENDSAYQGSQGQGFIVYRDDNIWGKGETSLIGIFNLLNILGTIATATKLGVQQEIILKAIKRFRAPKRRFEFKGITKKGLIVIDDFAHHPTAIQVTLKALRDQYPDKNITTIFHPHTYTRTQSLFNDFAKSFKNADQVIILDIYASAREKKGTVSSEQLVQAINVHSNNAKFIATKEEAFEYIKSNEIKQDIVITIGAGDVWKIADALINNKNIDE